jgi:hypothetical protein
LYTITQNTTEQEYKHQYPLYRTCRIRNSNLEKIKLKATRYGQSIDDILTDILNQLDKGYETNPSERSF